MRFVIGYSLALMAWIVILYTPFMEWRARKRRKGRLELVRKAWIEMHQRF